MHKIGSVVLVLLCVMLSGGLLLGCQPSSVTVPLAIIDGDSRAPVEQATLWITPLTVDPASEPPTPQVHQVLSGTLMLELAPGDYQVRAQAAGYLSSTQSLGTASQDSESYFVVLQRRLVQGLVLDAENGKPVAQAMVSLGTSQTETDSEGRFALPWSDLPALTVSHLHQRYLPTEVPLPAAGPGHLTVNVTLQARLVQGLVLDADTKQPLAGVSLQSGDQHQTTAQDGAFVLDRLAPKDVITLSATGYRPAEATAEDDSLELELSPYTITLTVSDANSKAPLAGVVVSGTIALGETDLQGTLTLRASPDDALALTVAGYAPLSATVPQDGALALAMTPSRLTLELRQAETGQPITRALALLYQGDDVTATASPNAEGDIVVDDASALTRVLIKAPSYAKVALPISRLGTQEIALAPFDVKAVYLPFGALALPERIESVLTMIETSPDLNGLVVDVKSDRARIAWQSQVPLAQTMEAYQGDLMALDALLAECQRRGIYTIARMVVFKDDLLARHEPTWAVVREDGTAYSDLEDLRWVDPFRQEVRDYDIALALEVAAMGFDEIQFDYLRFPSDGSTKGLVYQQESTFETRTAAMAEFTAQAYAALSKTPVFVSADIFGLTVWVDPARDMGIGQRVDDIAPNMDYLSPMLYPTTFGEGNLGFDDPALYPYEVVYHSVLKTLKRTDTPVRPWLQSYSIGGYEYGPYQLLAQKKGAEDAASHGWIYWNAAGKYRPEVFAENAYDLVEDLPEPPAEE